jgi:hypothetical protein
VASTLTNDVLV